MDNFAAFTAIIGFVLGFLACAVLVGLRNPQILAQARKGEIK